MSGEGGFSHDPNGAIHWHSPPSPESHALPVRMEAFAAAAPWAFAPAPPVELEPARLVWQAATPRPVSIAIRRVAVRARSFTFSELGESAWPATQSPAPARAPAGPRRDADFSRTTRIKPPIDLVKLEDRLRYVLQPPLESLLRGRRLSFPLAPFGYQLDGVAFLYPRHAAVLADEMGLGKTMQAITAMRLLLCGGEVSRILLVCPKPLVTNWCREFAVWAPEFPLAVIEGNQLRRRWLWRLPDVPVKIANYEVLHRDRELLDAAAADAGPPLRFDLVVLDESQRIKNRASATSRIVCAIDRDRAWALTGTPVENSSEDLVGIFEFLSPGLLSADMKPRRMGRLVRDFVLRRTKDQVLSDLPPKLFRDATLDLTPEQRESYRLAEDKGVLRLANLGPGITIQHVFELVLRLKQICNFDPATGLSAKLERLEADLEEVAASGRKAIVFSQWVQTLRRLAGHLQRFRPLEYHGQVPSGQRDAVIRRFRDDPAAHVLLISYGAGSVGLNLQFAHYVFLFDRWWNPAVEDQAINRAHRIGATGPVTVTRMITSDTIEERIHAVLEQKRELFDTIFSEAGGPARLGLSRREIFGLFHLDVPGGALPAAA